MPQANRMWCLRVHTWYICSILQYIGSILHLGGSIKRATYVEAPLFAGLPKLVADMPGTLGCLVACLELRETFFFWCAKVRLQDSP